MALTLVSKYTRALAEQLNAYYRVLKGTDPDSVDLRLNGGGHFIVHHSGTNAPLFSVTDAGAFGAITPIDGSVTNEKLAADAVTTDKIAPGAVMDSDVNAGAGIQVTKLVHLGAGNVLRSNGTQNVAGQVASGDIADGAIMNTDINGSAGIGLGKLATVSANQILKDVGSGVVGGGLLVDANVTNGTLTPGKMNAGGTASRVLKTNDGVTALWAQVVGADISGGAPPPNGTGAPDAWKVYATDAAGTTVALRAVVSAMIQDGTIATADLAANAISTLYSAAGSIGVTSTTPVDTTIGFSWTVAAGELALIGITGDVYNTTLATQSNTLQFNDVGSAQPLSRTFHTGAINVITPFGYTTVYSPAAGTRNVRVYAATSGGALGGTVIIWAVIFRR